MAAGVEITSTIGVNPPVIFSSSSTLQSNHKMKLNSTSNINYTYVNDGITATKYIRSLSVINEEFDKFLNTLDPRDVVKIISAVEEIHILPFVRNIMFNNKGTPTLKIQISELNREYEDKIYEIEYNLLRNINSFIDFFVKPF